MNPFGGNPPTQIVDSLLGKSYHVVKTVYLHLPLLKQVNDKAEVINFFFEHWDIVQNIESNIDALKDIRVNLEELLKAPEYIKEVKQEGQKQIDAIWEAKEEALRDFNIDIEDTVNQIKGYVTSAASFVDLAQQWATKVDGKIQDIDYSAKYYALDAKQTATELPVKELELEAQLTAYTDTQIARIDDKIDSILPVNATGCAEKTWTLTADVAANTEITIPGNIYYVVDRHHLRVGYNGLTCYIGTNFIEVGNTDTKSNKFKLTFDAKSGDELDVWVAALGKADVVDAVNTAQTANDAIAELSQKVVYKDQTSAESAGS